MKVDILDHNIFDSLNPQDLENYLINNNWDKAKTIHNEVSIWENNINGNKFRVWLPLNNNFADFSISIKRVIKTLSQLEDRSQLEILEDFYTVNIGDVVRVRSYDILNKADSTLEINDGLLLIKRAKDMLLSAACATIEPKPVFPSRKPIKVEDFAKKLRLGQTEHGSYIIKLISPITVVESNQHVIPEFPEKQPFERLSIITLMNSLNALKKVSEETFKRGRFYFEPFNEIVVEGVSANLCDAITGLNEKTNYTPIEVGVSWSYIPIEKHINEKVEFPLEVMPYISEASRQFHEKNPEDNFVLEGNVTKLHRENQKKGNGIITVVCIIEGKKRRVKVELYENDYDIAIEAHKEGLEIYCSGQMIKEGNSFKLNNPSNFKLLQEDG